MLQIPSALLLQYKACSKKGSVATERGRTITAHKGEEGRGAGGRSGARGSRGQPSPRTQPVGCLGAQGPACWGTDPMGFLRKDSLKAGCERRRETPSSPDWSLLGMKGQGITCPHILVTAHASYPLGLLWIVCLGSLRPRGLRAPTCPAALPTDYCPPWPNLHFLGEIPASRSPGE